MDKLSTLLNSLNKEEQIIAEINRFPYIYSKAELFLKIGPEAYRKDDYYAMPLKTWSKEDIFKITLGCEQLMLCKGLSSEQPLENIGINAFYKLFELFHFKSIHQKAKRVKLGNKKYFIDEIKFKHQFDDSTITYFNLVS